MLSEVEWVETIFLFPLLRSANVCAVHLVQSRRLFRCCSTLGNDSWHCSQLMWWPQNEQRKQDVTFSSLTNNPPTAPSFFPHVRPMHMVAGPTRSRLWSPTAS